MEASETGFTLTVSSLKWDSPPAHSINSMIYKWHL